jgi:hypothetical protein
MKRIVFALLPLLLNLVSVRAQPGKAPALGGAMPGLGLSDSTARLFGDNSSFSARLEMQTGGGAEAETMTMPGKLLFDQGKSRFELELSQLSGGKMSPEAAAQMKSIGMDRMIMISRPDKKLGYQVYPGMQGYVESALPEGEAGGKYTDFKLETTEIAKETVDNHPCVKNKTVVTDKDGAKHEAMVWNATDLKKFPVKIEYTEDKTKISMLFHEVSLAKPPAESFDPPTDLTKYDSMQSMMQQVLIKRMGAPRPPQGQ